jgi:hypothetical protein
MPAADTLSLDDRRRALEFAGRLATLALEAPDERTKKIVYTARNQIQKLYGLGREEKKIEILRLITLGAAQISDLILESGFHRDDVYEITAELVGEKAVREMRMRQTGGNGRPSVCFFPLDE